MGWLFNPTTEPSAVEGVGPITEVLLEPAIYGGEKNCKILTPPVTVYLAMPHDQPLGSTVRSHTDWECALAEHDRWLRTVVLARVGEAQVVNDIMQEISLAAIRQAAPLEDPDKVAPWLYRVAVRQALLYRRSQGRRRKLTERITRRVECGEQRCDANDPLEWLLTAERRRLVREALAELSGRDAEVLLLKYTEDWSYRQLADHLGISCSAVEARLHRARARLRSALWRRDFGRQGSQAGSWTPGTDKLDQSDRETTQVK